MMGFIDRVLIETNRKITKGHQIDHISNRAKLLLKVVVLVTVKKDIIHHHVIVNTTLTTNVIDRLTNVVTGHQSTKYTKYTCSHLFLADEIYIFFIMLGFDSLVGHKKYTLNLTRIL